MEIRVAGLDPAFRNFGVAIGMLDIESMRLKIEKLVLLQTKNNAGKQVYKSSDNLRGAIHLHESLLELVEPCSMIFSEIPSGAQSASASHQLGIALGILAGLPQRLIQVQPLAVKLATVGKKTASKQEMIDWAEREHPNAPWIRRKLKSKLVLTKANEHLADAVASIHAGMKTPEFLQVVKLWSASPARKIA